MEISYIRDLDHNYLVMKSDRTEYVYDEGANTAGNSRYAERMLSSYTPSGVIGFEIRSRNQEDHLFYKTDSLISLTNRTLTKKLSRQEMYALLESLCSAQESIGEYLLDMSHLFLSADTVFTNPSTHQWFFICYPYVHEDQGTLETFLEELINLVSTADDDAVSEMFALCELAGRKNSHLREMLKEVRRIYDVDVDCSASACESSYTGGCDEEEEVQRPTYAEMNGRLRTIEELSDGEVTKSQRIFTEKRNRKIKTERPSIRLRRDRSRTHLIIPVLFMIVFLVPVYIRKEYVLSEAANIACSVIMGLCAAGAVGSFLLERHAEYADEEEDVADEDAEFESDKRVEKKYVVHEPLHEPYNEENQRREFMVQTAAQSNKVNGGKESRTQDRIFTGEGEKHDVRVHSDYTGKTSSIYNPYSRFFAGYEQEEKEDCTLLLTDIADKRTPKLYGRNSAASTNILLERLPLTLGSLGGSVDYQLNDRSVSRMHAYIGKNESGHIFLKDLGSTNGTYLNGKRLDSNEIRLLNCGDEVRFGAMEFEYI